MNKVDDVVYMCAQPIDSYYTWQVLSWLQSLEDIGKVDGVHVLLYKPKGFEVPKAWDVIRNLYPKALVEVYEEDALEPFMKVYPPVIRPAILAKHFTKYPHLKTKAIFYCDSDIMFTEPLDINKYLADDICYLSDTISYIGADYINGKKRDCMPRVADMMERKDVLADMCRIVGIDRQTAEDNKMNSGGAQYLLKNVDEVFWAKVMKDCVSLNMYLRDVNETYFENEAKGYQAWCADMWAVLYNLWKFGKETRVVWEMNFAWATDTLDRLEVARIIHNAGVTNESVMRTRHKNPSGDNMYVDAPAFYKGRFRKGGNPLADEKYIDSILNHEVSKNYVTHKYLQHLVKHRDKINALWEIVKS